MHAACLSELLPFSPFSIGLPNFAGPIASLPQYLAAQLAASSDGQLELMQQWQQQQQASQTYLQLLQQVLTSLLQLVQEHMLGQQQVCFGCLGLHCKAGLLRVM